MYATCNFKHTQKSIFLVYQNIVIQKVKDEKGEESVEAHLHHYMSYDTKNDCYLIEKQLSRTLTSAIKPLFPNIEYVYYNTDGCKEEVTSNVFFLRW